mgnify:CR=1 FL=1
MIGFLYSFCILNVKCHFLWVENFKAIKWSCLFPAQAIFVDFGNIIVIVLNLQYIF